MNVGYSVDAIEAAAKIGAKTFIGAGSQAEYGRHEGALSEKTPCFPENGYGIAKLAAGEFTRLRASQLQIKHVWTRILSVYGPCDGKGTMIMSAIRTLLDGERPSLTKGEQLWDYLYSKDAGRALYLLGEKGKDQKTYIDNLKCGWPKNDFDPQNDIRFFLKERGGDTMYPIEKMSFKRFDRCDGLLPDNKGGTLREDLKSVFVNRDFTTIYITVISKDGTKSVRRVYEIIR